MVRLRRGALAALVAVLGVIWACNLCTSFLAARGSSALSSASSDAQLGRRQALFGAASLPTASLIASSPANAGGSCDVDKKTFEDGLKSKIGTIMSDCVLKDPPGGTWKDRCIRAFGKPEGGKACMTRCVMSYTQISKPCADCWGGLAQCTYDNCAMNCLTPDSKECTSCTASFCDKNFESCSGIKL
eukprot:CAMPEP_0115476556 /NCGR_PEP_ID=MMETSP0271-20121206/55200_1 /TAXON_ID=71861 /ORGANISM="Scrippsiella trochoidea, Strain CCMP3099" /LENGTH=186 /DNA_ID=CAMNT_0002903977 /DNA_START=1 /DNA_END=561 /DNA_ORIENTATION=+